MGNSAHMADIPNKDDKQKLGCDSNVNFLRWFFTPTRHYSELKPFGDTKKMYEKRVAREQGVNSSNK